MRPETGLRPLGDGGLQVCPYCDRVYGSAATYCDLCEEPPARPVVPPTPTNPYPTFDQYSVDRDEGEHDGGMGSGDWLRRNREIEERMLE